MAHSQLIDKNMSYVKGKRKYIVVFFVKQVVTLIFARGGLEHSCQVNISFTHFNKIYYNVIMVNVSTHLIIKS